jgi:hypothetical protein
LLAAATAAAIAAEEAAALSSESSSEKVFDEDEEKARQDQSDDDGENRSLNNIKGDAELSALKVLGFVLNFNGYSIEAGIKLHSEGRLPSAQVGMYGLQEVQQCNGRPLLCLSKPAARQPSGVKSYTDPKLW